MPSLLADGCIVAALNRLAAIAGSMILGALLLSGCASTSQAGLDNRPFFQPEYGLDTHGRKAWFDHLVEADPGRIKTPVAYDYEEGAPARIAVLPFGDYGSGLYVLNKIPPTHRTGDKLNQWAWNDGAQVSAK